MTGQGLKKAIWDRLNETKEDVSMLWGVLLAIDHAMKTGFNVWDVYGDAVRGLAKQACTVQEELASLARLLDETGVEEKR